ncbi:type VI secretion system tube protein TssD [Bacteroides sp.]
MGLFSLPQIDSDLTAWFILDGKEYEMSQFIISFGQSVDHKGQPQDEVRGGRMLVALTQTLPESLYRWAMSSIPKSGEIVFRSKTTNAPLRIEFMNAYCVSFQRNISDKGGVDTVLNISPDELLINGISFDNHWV